MPSRLLGTPLTHFRSTPGRTKMEKPSRKELLQDPEALGLAWAQGRCDNPLESTAPSWLRPKDGPPGDSPPQQA